MGQNLKPNKQLLTIRGGVQLSGTIRISGAKNSTLPIMAACLLSKEQITLRNVPNLLDVQVMINLLQSLGAEVEMKLNNTGDGLGHVVKILAQNIKQYTIPERIAGMLRASSLIMGPLLARLHKAVMPMPGGCTIGSRPIDMHIKALSSMNAIISTTDKYVTAKAHKGLIGSLISFHKVSVGATENALMAAVLANGETIIENAAIEPEVVDLSKFLVSIGAKILGIGTTRLVITGASKLRGGDYTVMPDRLEIGTYSLAALITGGHITMNGINISMINCIAKQFRLLGGEFRTTKNGLLAYRAKSSLQPLDLVTEPYPGFPSDMQAQFMSTLCLAHGTSTIEEKIFDNRMQHVLELQKMGANIDIINRSKAIVYGIDKYSPCNNLKATDLRAAAALILAALTVDGSSTIYGIQHMSRGYEDWTKKLQSCGANLCLQELEDTKHNIDIVKTFAST